MAENPRAFPSADSRGPLGEGLMQGSPGMSLRDWFAGQALAAMQIDHDGKYSQADLRSGHALLAAQWRATAAYRIADAMLAERETPR